MKRLCLVMFLLTVSSLSQAADRNGEFVVKGFGAQSCETFLDERLLRSTQYVLFRSWLNESEPPWV